MSVELRVMLVPGWSERARWIDVLRYLTGPGFMALFFTAIFVFTSFDPKGMAPHIGYVALFLVWMSAGIAYCGFHALGTLGYAWAFGLRGAYFLPLASVFATVLATVVLWLVFDLMTSADLPRLRQVLTDVPINYMWAMVFEFLAFAFVRPVDVSIYRKALDAARSVAGGAEDDKVTLPREFEHLQIGERAVLREELLYLRADGHHVEVTTKREVFSVRARLRDIVGQLVCDEGFQPHRSWWVAVRAVAGVSVRGSDGLVVLRLVDGAEINVTRARMTAFNEMEDKLNAAARAHRLKHGLLRRLRVPTKRPSAQDQTDRLSDSRSHFR